jgi:hypothetical protein
MDNEGNIIFRIPMCIDRSSSDPLTTYDSSGVLFGVVRGKRTSSFYIGSIDQKSTKSDIVHYIESKDDTVCFCFFVFFIIFCFIFYFHIKRIIYYIYINRTVLVVTYWHYRKLSYSVHWNTFFPCVAISLLI